MGARSVLKEPEWEGHLRRGGAVSLGLVLCSALLPVQAEAQRAVDVQVGKWAVPGPDPTFYSAALWRRLLGPAGYALRGLSLADGDSLGRSLYGLGFEITLFRGVGRLVPYGLGGLGLAVESGASSGVAALWNAGVGLELNRLSWLSIAAEVRRFAEDRGLGGFWNLQPSDRRGWLYSARISLRWGGRAGAHAGTSKPTRARPPLRSPEAASTVDAAEPLGEDGLRRATQIVETALGVMGEPYRWGGTRTEDGFDCSGLIWYAYRSQGVSVPRVSRDQARIGRYVLPNVALLEPGDILLFANRPNAVTHVGLYIGNAKFIHATTSGGVRVGALDAVADENDRWWLRRWVGARRVLR